MPRKKSEDPAGLGMTFQVRLNAEQTSRWQRLWEITRERTRNTIGEAELNRLLLGLKDNAEVLTEMERGYFQGKVEEAKMRGPTKAGAPHIRKVASPKNGRK